MLLEKRLFKDFLTPKLINKLEIPCRDLLFCVQIYLYILFSRIWNPLCKKIK